jgi:hypothetical protein
MHNKLKITRFFLITALMQFSLAITSSNPNKSSLTSQQQSAVLFKENKGQACDQNSKPRQDVLFSGINENLLYYLKTRGVSYQITKVDEWRSNELYSRSNENSFVPASKKIPARSITYKIDVNWLDANSNYAIEKGEEELGVENFYTAANHNGITNVNSFKDLMYKNIYNSIDLKWYQKFCIAVFEPLNSEASFFNSYQNPSQGEITIELSQYYLSQSNEGKTHLHILNSLGQILFHKIISTQFTKLNHDELAVGDLFSNWTTKRYGY